MVGSVAVRLCPCAPVVGKPHLGTRVSDQFKPKPNVSFPVKTAFPCLNVRASVLQASVMSTPSIFTTKKGSSMSPFSQSLLDQKRSSCIVRASKKEPFFPPYPKMEQKPRWWWRTLACLPYLMNFYDHQFWIYAHPAKNPPVFLENFDNFFFPLVSAIFCLPRYLLALYAFVSFFLIVRRKELPHFFRYHMINAILMGTFIQITGIAGGWIPEWMYPRFFWSTATLMFLGTVLECIRCALCGLYAEVPFVQKGAHLYSDLNQR